MESDDAPEGPPSRSTGQDAAPDTAERSASPDRLDSGQGLLDEGPDDVVKETLSAGPSYEDLQVQWPAVVIYDSLWSLVVSRGHWWSVDVTISQ